LRVAFSGIYVIVAISDGPVVSIGKMNSESKSVTSGGKELTFALSKALLTSAKLVS
jgi:hypothetical protein